MTDLDIANRALGLIGQDTVPSLATSLNNKTVVAVNLQLDGVKEEALRSRDWNCARRRAAVVQTTTNESLGEWTYSYRTPSDCLAVRRFVGEWRCGPSRAFSWESDSEGKRVLYCNEADAKIVYTGNLTDVNRWDSLLFNYCVGMLGERLAASFAKDMKMAMAFAAAALQKFDDAVGVDEAEGQREIEVSTGFVDVRSGSGEWWRPWRAT